MKGSTAGLASTAPASTAGSPSPRIATLPALSPVNFVDHVSFRRSAVVWLISPGAVSTPDGMRCDVDGNLYIADYFHGQVKVVPAGQL